MMKKFFLVVLACRCLTLGPVHAAGLDDIGTTLNDLGAGELASAVGVDLSRVADYLDWERLNVSLRADMENEVLFMGRRARVDSVVYKQGLTAVRIDIKGALELQEGGSPLRLAGFHILEYPLRDKALIVFPARKGYMEIDPDKVRELLGDRIEKNRKNPGKVEKKEKLGVEEFDSYACEKLHVVKTTGSGGRNDITAWLARDLGGFPVKSLVAFTLPRGQSGTASVVFRNIVKGEQDGSLFELPPGYEKYDNLVELATEGRMGSRLGKPGERKGLFKRRK